MKKRLVFITGLIAAVVAFTAVSIGAAPPVSAASAKTGVGLSEHVLKAYNEGWKYRSACYGQFVNGTRSSDCSGLIKSYLWWTGETTDPRPGLVSVAGSSGDMLSSASSKGKINYSDSSSLPRIHGLILYQPGHVGVYVGNNMAVDNRTTGVNVKYEKVFGRSSPKWTMWFKLPQISYPTTGFATFNGNKYYYENGQYVVNTTKTINGTAYTFGSSGTITGTTGAEPQAAVSSAADVTKTVAVRAQAAKTTAVKTSTASYSTLKVDSKSDDVKKLQQRLKDLGYYYESVNTYYDYCVSDAVSAYQNAAGLKVTGAADPTTLANIYATGAPKNANPGTLTPGMHSSLVSAMQTRLIALGYLTGETTAFYGEATKQGVLAYQKAAGIAQTGIMDKTNLGKLYADSAVKAPAQSTPQSEKSTASSQSEPVTSTRTIVHDDIVPTANAAVVGKTEEKPVSNNGFAFFIVLSSAFLTGTFMLLKKLKQRSKKTQSIFIKENILIKDLLHHLKIR